MRSLLCAGLVSIALVSPCAVAAPDQQQSGEPIYRAKKTAVVNRNCDVVWGLLTDFSGIAQWYSGFESSKRIAGSPGTLGEVRELKRKGTGQIVHEKLIYLNRSNGELGYTHTLNPPVRNSIAIVTLNQIGQGQCLVTWANTFRPLPGKSGQEMTIKLDAAYQTVLDDLKKHIEN